MSIPKRWVQTYTYGCCAAAVRSSRETASLISRVAKKTIALPAGELMGKNKVVV